MTKTKAINPVKAVAAYIPLDSDFRLKSNDDAIAIDENFAAQNFWKDVFIRYFRKASAVIGLILIVFITFLAVVGPGMNDYTYSGQELSQKNFAPRIKALEKFGIFDGTEFDEFVVDLTGFVFLSAPIIFGPSSSSLKNLIIVFTS